MNIFSELKRSKYKICTIIKKIWWKLEYGKRCTFGKRFCFRNMMLINICDTGNTKIGDNVFFNNGCSINSHCQIIIGDNCIFGENVKIYDHNHIFSEYDKPIYSQGYKNKMVEIGNDCWIGSNVTILPGSIIGCKTIIGAGCVIFDSIPEGSIVTTASRELRIKRRIRDGE